MNDFSEIIRFYKSDEKLKIIYQELSNNIQNYLSNLPECSFSSFEEVYKHLPRCQEKQLIINNINHIINCFSVLKEISSFKFEITTKNSCQIFHQDYIDFRIVVTYLGPGTEFLQDSNVNFNYLDKDWDDPDSHNLKLIKDHNLITTYPTNSICCFKGKKDHSYGQFHRSPDLEKFNLKRAVLIIN